MKKYVAVHLKWICITLIIVISICIYCIHITSQPSVNHTLFNNLNDTEKHFVIDILARTANGESITLEDYNPPSRNASLAIIQEFENSGIK